MAMQKLGPLQRKWIARLRSGRYKQTKGALHRVRNGKHSFCCLGIACETLQIPGKAVGENVCYGPSEESKTMPRFAWEALKLRKNAGQAKSGDSLVALNDSGKSFLQIADMVTADPANYFTGPI